MRCQLRSERSQWRQDMRMCLERCGRYLRPCPGLETCTILHHPAAWPAWSDQFWRVIPKFPGQASGGKLKLDSKLRWPRCLELPWVSYICLLHPTWMCISVCQWFISHSASVQILDVFWSGSCAQRSPFYTPKLRANPTKTRLFFARKPAE